MATLVIYAHPQTDGCSSTVLQEITRNLRLKKEHFEILDLYEMNYDPILHAMEHYTVGNKLVSEQNKNIQQKIKAMDKIIFIYPDWWSSMPAILKGFIDRVFVKGFAFDYSPKGKIIKLLKQKKVLAFISHGGPGWYHFITGNKASNMMKKNVSAHCGMKAKIINFYSAHKLNEEAKSKINKSVNKAINKFY